MLSRCFFFLYFLHRSSTLVWLHVVEHSLTQCVWRDNNSHCFNLAKRAKQNTNKIVEKEHEQQQQNWHQLIFMNDVFFYCRQIDIFRDRWNVISFELARGYVQQVENKWNKKNRNEWTNKSKLKMKSKIVISLLKVNVNVTDILGGMRMCKRSFFYGFRWMHTTFAAYNFYWSNTQHMYDDERYSCTINMLCILWRRQCQHHTR